MFMALMTVQVEEWKCIFNVLNVSSLGLQTGSLLYYEQSRNLLGCHSQSAEADSVEHKGKQHKITP